MTVLLMSFISWTNQGQKGEPGDIADVSMVIDLDVCWIFKYQ